MRRAVTIECKSPFAVQIKGKEAIINTVVASRGSLITDCSLFGKYLDGSPASCTYILADAPETVRTMVNAAFSAAYEE